MVASANVLLEGIRSALAETGVDVEDVYVQQAGRRELVRVIVDRDGGVDLDRVAEVSRKISELFDTPPLADEFVGTFVLEVTSPGVDRPLTEQKHWRRAVKRNVEVHLKDNSIVVVYADLAATCEGEQRADAVLAASECATRAVIWGAPSQAFPHDASLT